MAITLKTRFSIDFSGVVRNSLEAVKSIRRSEQAKNEANFQRAIADGLSYEEQLVIRQKQLEDAKAEGAPDAEYIAKLEESIAGTKKLARFNNYRTKYSETLGELSSGKINEEQYLKSLKGMLRGVDDPELRLEIQGDITAAEAKVKTYRDTILDNRVRKAKYDGTQKSLKDAVRRVKQARSEAALNNNEDEVTAYDETLAALNSQLSTVKIQDSITDFQVHSATRGTNPIEKLNYINDQIEGADSESAIKIGDKTYESAAQFWALERDGYLAGSSQIFGNFFNELEADAKNKITANTVQFGYPTQPVLDATVNEFNNLKGRPEVAPFIDKLNVTQAVVMSEAVDKLARQVLDVATNNLTFSSAANTLNVIQNKYGVAMDSYRIALDEKLRSQIASDAAQGIEPDFVIPDIKVDAPQIDGAPGLNTPPISVVPPTPVTPETPSAPVVPGSVPITVPETPAAPVTPVPPVVPPTQTPGEAPVNQSKEQPNQSFAVPQFTPSTGIGTVSPDGRFKFTSTGWKPIGTTTPAAPATPTATPNQSKAVPNQSKEVPNQSKALPVNPPQAPKQPVVNQSKEVAPKPPVNRSLVPPSYTPASGIGTKSADGNFQFTKDGWKQIM